MFHLGPTPHCRSRDILVLMLAAGRAGMWLAGDYKQATSRLAGFLNSTFTPDNRELDMSVAVPDVIPR